MELYQQKRRRSNIAIMVLFMVGAYVLVSDDDYHKMIDSTTTIRYNCDMLVDGHNPDVPQYIINECIKRESI